jgi:hypothetical protein
LDAEIFQAPTSGKLVLQPSGLPLPDLGFRGVVRVHELGGPYAGIAGDWWWDRKAGLSGYFEVVLHASSPLRR